MRRVSPLPRTLAIVCTAASLVWASPKPRPLAEELTGEARAAFERGRDLFEHDDFATAHAKFRQAYDLAKSPRLLWNMAACSAKLKRYARAIGEVDRYLDAGGVSLSPDAQDRARAFSNEMKSYVTEATVRVSPSDSALSVDDEPRPLRAGTATLFLEIGKHGLRVEKDGFESVSRSVDVGDIGKMAIRIDLVPAGRVAPWSAASSLPADAPSKSERPLWPWLTGGAVLAVGAGLGAYFLFKPESSPSPYVAGTAGSFEVR
jgi:hypothetical protein